MRQGSIIASSNKDYILSDRWKCKKSLSGAHYWIIQSHEMTCKYCNENKPIDANPPVNLNQK